MEEASQKLGLERLEKLANHLLYGKLGHEVFDFGIYNSSMKSECGTRGCAIGECPIAFPEYWNFNENGQPICEDLYSSRRSAILFFKITPEEYGNLFAPSSLYEKRLNRYAKKEEVANNIIEFVKKKRYEAGI